MHTAGAQEIQVTPDDIENSRRFGVNDPLLLAVQRATGTMWKMMEYGVLGEVNLPRRCIVLPAEILRRWQQHRSTGHMEPFCLTAKFTIVE